MPTVLEEGTSAVELGSIASSRSPERDHGQHLGFDQVIPLSRSLPIACDRVEGDDGSDSDTTNRFRFRKRKRGSEVDNLRPNVPLSSHTQESYLSRVTESQRGETDGDRRKRRRHGDRDRNLKQGDRSLSGVLTEGDSDDAARIRGACRRMGLTTRGPNVGRTSDLASERKRRCRFASLSRSDKSRNSGVVASPEKTAQLLPESACCRKQCRPHLFSITPSTDLSSDEEKRYGHNNLTSADRASRSDLGTSRSPWRLHKINDMVRSNQDGVQVSADDSEDESQREIVWRHESLIGYKVVNGKPGVLVPWCPTRESPDE